MRSFFLPLSVVIMLQNIKKAAFRKRDDGVRSRRSTHGLMPRTVDGLAEFMCRIIRICHALQRLKILSKNTETKNYNKKMHSNVHSMFA